LAEKRWLPQKEKRRQKEGDNLFCLHVTIGRLARISFVPRRETQDGSKPAVLFHFENNCPLSE
jgi:hypothetical protein